MQQDWTNTTTAPCAIWGCDRLLDMGWALRWHEIDGTTYAICQTGHGTTNQAREILIDQAWAVHDSMKAIRERRAQKNPTG